MAVALPIAEFLARARELPVLDVRTPAEFAKGHVPGAVNLPLFSNEERAGIGTAYLHQGRQSAVQLGLAMVGPRLPGLATALLAAASPGGLLIHCWRGGMRSESMAWLAGMLGCRVATLAGGYKSFRREALACFDRERKLRVVAGLTGTGKTAVLHALAERGEPVLDLEALARHKGSVFGDLGEQPQPTQEQFENDLATALWSTDPGRPLWIEDESQTIGRRVVPPALWNRKRRSRFAVIELPLEARVDHLCKTYQNHPAEQLESRIEGIRRRLGGERTNQALAAFRAGDTAAACRLLLHYYDRTYRNSLAALPAEQVSVHHFERCDPGLIADTLRNSTLSNTSQPWMPRPV